MELIEPYELRVAKLREFLEDVKPSLRYDIVRLIDPYGPSVTDPDLQCLVVSQETRRGGEAVNKQRLENVNACGLALPVALVCPGLKSRMPMHVTAGIRSHRAAFPSAAGNVPPGDGAASWGHRGQPQPCLCCSIEAWSPVPSRCPHC